MKGATMYEYVFELLKGGFVYGHRKDVARKREPHS